MIKRTVNIYSYNDTQFKIIFNQAFLKVNLSDIWEFSSQAAVHYKVLKFSLDLLKR